MCAAVCVLGGGGGGEVEREGEARGCKIVCMCGEWGKGVCVGGGGVHVCGCRGGGGGIESDM